MNEPEKYLTPEKMNEVRQRNRSLRRQFLKYKDAEIVYSLTHRKLLEMADEAECHLSHRWNRVDQPRYLR